MKYVSLLIAVTEEPLKVPEGMVASFGNSVRTEELSRSGVGTCLRALLKDAEENARAAIFEQLPRE